MNKTLTKEKQLTDCTKSLINELNSSFLIKVRVHNHSFISALFSLLFCNTIDNIMSVSAAAKVMKFRVGLCQMLVSGVSDCLLCIQ